MTKSLVNSPVRFDLNRTWDFGSHALLSQDDINFLSCMLECQECRLRRVYHSLAARELSLRQNDLVMRPIQPRLYFHQISRLIKAILIATKKQLILYRSGRSLCSHTPPASCSRRRRRPRVERWICSTHATDVFRYMFYAADDSIYNLNLREVQSSRPAEWVGVIFPKGQSEFFMKGLTKFELASSVPRHRTSYAVPNFLPRSSGPASLTGFTFMLGIKNLNKSGNGKRMPKKDIRAANRRWNEGYKDVKTVRLEDGCGKKVRFPKHCPITRIYHLITYGTAMKLLREDRTWEFYGIDRIMGRLVEDEAGEEEADEAAAAAAYSEDGRSGNRSKDDEVKHLVGNALSTLSLETVANSADSVMETVHKRCRRKHREICNKSDQFTPSENVPSCGKSELLQITSLSSFHLGSVYLDDLSSFLFNWVCSSSSAKPNTSP
ncbi:hypothetical protein TcWFU_001573 [Taenia crassiceps]|uniref:Uncharacterized protein n=1 Tax=Taenia crassiceps TaxID=6207 RepID=A0ABR4QGB7_9CEST